MDKLSAWTGVAVAVVGMALYLSLGFIPELFHSAIRLVAVIATGYMAVKFFQLAVVVNRLGGFWAHLLIAFVLSAAAAIYCSALYLLWDVFIPEYRSLMQVVAIATVFVGGIAFAMLVALVPQRVWRA